ncbi:ATPase domain-containing protein, partial [Xanthomonas sontii]|uniref:ATPase domain-containing protein n=1 Tax=Xanthomonas sontii TaxID=2650745 RepID=UPI003CCD465A
MDLQPRLPLRGPRTTWVAPSADRTGTSHYGLRPRSKRWDRSGRVLRLGSRCHTASGVISAPLASSPSRAAADCNLPPGGTAPQGPFEPLPSTETFGTPIIVTDQIAAPKMLTALAKSPTGIAGFDDLTFGGLPAGRPSLICGAAGCGKTLFATT